MTAGRAGIVEFTGRLAESYASGRRLLPQTAALWIDAARRHLGRRGVRRLVDVGCGTGRFAPLLADALGAQVTGIDPSADMLRAAAGGSAHPRVAYARADASALPLRDASVDAAWLSMVVHLLPDLAVAAAELRRVLVPDGAVLVRASVRERLSGVRMYRYFPSALRADAARVPSLDETIRGFAAGGFRVAAHEVIVQTTDSTLAAHADRLRLRAMSSFAFVPDDEFDAGMRALEADASVESPPSPVTEEMDLLRFERG